MKILLEIIIQKSFTLAFVHDVFAYLFQNFPAFPEPLLLSSKATVKPRRSKRETEILKHGLYL